MPAAGDGRVVGAVLCGGASRRMGTPKALVEVDGVPMAARVAGAMSQAGAGRIVLVGGDPAWSTRLHLPLVPDRWPGEGPLGGLATALLDHSGEDGGTGGEIVLVVACDQPWMDGGSLRLLLGGLAAEPMAVAAVAVGIDGRRAPFPAAWRSSEAARLRALVEGGARRAGVAVDGQRHVQVVLPPGVLADVDRPEDLPGGGPPSGP
ncbi:molybdenum cofactor guanylyltransferase [soil metagenome]